MPQGPILPWLAAELLQIRVEAELSLTQMSARVGVERSALNKIERGENWPRHVDALVGGYAEVAGITSLELWRRVLRAWATASDHPEAVELAARLAP